MNSWRKLFNEDNSEEREAIKPVDKEWQRNLASKGIQGSPGRDAEMSENYKAITGLDAKQLRDELNGNDIRDNFSKAALTETTHLLQDQTNVTKDMSGVDNVKQALESERSKRRGLFW